MEKLQPLERAFELYVKLGLQRNFAEITSPQVQLLKGLSKIDDALLIVDDIFDESETRNGKPCLYKQEGVQKAIVTAELLKTQAYDTLFELMKECSTSKENQLKIMVLMNDFFRAMYVGEQIDLELGQETTFYPDQINKCLRMNRTFTGGHIKFGLEIGQLLNNLEIDSDISEIALALGTIRQICDDFNDYFPDHHEPFGDFLTGSNRIPEVLFNKYKGDRNKVLYYIGNQDLKKAREYALSTEIRNELYQLCENEMSKCKSIVTSFDYSRLIEDYDKIKTRLD